MGGIEPEPGPPTPNPAVQWLVIGSARGRQDAVLRPGLGAAFADSGPIGLPFLFTLPLISCPWLPKPSPASFGCGAFLDCIFSFRRASCSASNSYEPGRGGVVSPKPNALLIQLLLFCTRVSLCHYAFGAVIDRLVDTSFEHRRNAQTSKVNSSTRRRTDNLWSG